MNLLDAGLTAAGIVTATVAVLVVATVPVPQAVSVAVGLPYLLFVTGYAVVFALFPSGLFSERQRAAERLATGVVAVVTSVVLAIVVGVNLQVLSIPIREVNYVGVLAGVTIAATAVGLGRRGGVEKFRQGNPTRADLERVGRASLDRLRQPVAAVTPTNTRRTANILVLVAIVVAGGAIATANVVDQRGEQYTEFGLLNGADAGDPTVTTFPSEVTAGESIPLEYVVTNREQRSVSYTIIVQLAIVGEDGTVEERVRLDSFVEELAAGETTERPHTVVPNTVGERVRLTYLLYKSEPPAAPTRSNAYREVHIWLTVTP